MGVKVISNYLRACMQKRSFDEALFNAFQVESEFKIMVYEKPWTEALQIPRHYGYYINKQIWLVVSQTIYKPVL